MNAARLLDLVDRADGAADALDALAEAVEAEPALEKLTKQARFIAEQADLFAGRLGKKADAMFPPQATATVSAGPEQAR